MENQPPGTVLLEDPNAPLKHGQDGEVVLQPQPTRDPNDPLNWSLARKWVNFGIIAFYTLMVFAFLDIAGTVWQDFVVELGVSYAQLNNTSAAAVSGLAGGCIFLIPLALKYGRRPLYIVTSVVNFAMAIYSACMHNYGDLITTSLISGISGSISEVIVQMTVADIFFVHQRGLANAVYLLTVNIGAYLAPVAAGYIAVSEGWRWIFWWTAIFLGVTLFLFVFCYEETKYIPSSTASGRSSPSPTPIRMRTESPAGPASPSKVASPITSPVQNEGDMSSPSSSDAFLGEGQSSRGNVDHSIPMRTYWQRMAFTTTSEAPASLFVRHIYQPFVILATIPAYLFCALTFGTEFCWFSMISVTENSVFPYPPYNFSPAGIGLLGVPAMIGAALGALYEGLLSDRAVVWLSKRNAGVYEPEFRLIPPLLPAIANPAGVLVYGLSVAAGKHWIVPCVGICINAFGSAGMSHAVLTYVIDAYPEIAGDGLVGVTFLRNAMTMIVLFAASAWLDIGFRNCFVSIGCLAAFFNFLVVPMILFGKRFRRATAKRYRELAKKQYNPRQI